MANDTALPPDGGMTSDGPATRRVVEDAPTRMAVGEATATAVTDPQATLRVLEDTELGETRMVRDVAAFAQEGYPLGTLMPGVVICGNCVVERTLQPHESQRPGLYLCHAPEGQVIVKVYATQYPPKPELWQRLSFLHHRHVIRTHRTVEEGEFFYEVQEYCAGGSLAERVPRPGSGRPAIPTEWIMEVLLPHIHEGLKYLQQQEIIHRDIKPANIYQKTTDGRETLVLADFDISAVLEQTHTSRDTLRAAGTWLYTAPEAFPRFVDDHASGRKGRITRSSDYYSFGITIIEMLLGTTSLHQCQLPDLFDFYLQGERVEIPKGIPGRLALLLRGLLIRNRHTRWTADEVERWLRNTNTDADLQSIHDDEYYELARASRPYRLGNRFAVDLPSLAETLYQEQAIATEDLITGDILLNWIGHLDPNVAREIRRERDQNYLAPDVVLHTAIMWCDPTRPFIFGDGSEATTPDEWVAQAIKVARKTKTGMEDLCSPALLRQLEIWLRAKAHPEPKLAEGLTAIRTSPPRVRLEEIAYLFQPDRPFAIMRGVAARTPREVVQAAYGQPEEWKSRRPICYESTYQRWYDGALCAWLRQRGLGTVATQCDEVRLKLAEDPFAAFETILRLLDPALPKVQVVLDLSDMAAGCRIAYGKARNYTIRHTTRGPGIPFGALKLQSPAPGVIIENRVIRQREGTLEITIDTKFGDLPAFKPYQALLGMDSGVAQIVNLPAKFSYRSIYPTRLAVNRLVAGAVLGAFTLGFPRLLIALFDNKKLVTLARLNFDTLWEDIAYSRYPHMTLMLSLLFLAICLYGGIWLWIKALRESET